jgi:hypothetical protein
MKKRRLLTIVAVMTAMSMVVFSCSKDDDEETPTTPSAGESSSELLVAKFTAAPVLDGDIDAMWANAQLLKTSCEVPTLGSRMTYLNSDGAGVEEGLGLFHPYNGEVNPFTMRAGYFGDDIYMLIEWDDDDDSKDRQSWYFDGTWKQEHKYANANDDKFYEDKFAFLFPNGDVTGFNASTCYATCHTVSTIENAKDKHTRHYLTTSGEKIDMWHWKRVRGTYNDRVDDQRMTYVDPPYTSASNGRSGDEAGGSGYSDNKQTLNNGTDDVSVPLYVVPNGTDYWWIGEDELDVTAIKVVGVDANGVLSLDDNTLLDPASGDYAQGTGVNRIPSVLTHDFTGARADITIKVKYTGTGWVAELQRKLNTGDVDDAVFDITNEYPFGFAIFDNAAIAHSIKPGLNMKFVQ